jgi:hypothetical protein
MFSLVALSPASEIVCKFPKSPCMVRLVALLRSLRATELTSCAGSKRGKNSCHSLPSCFSRPFCPVYHAAHGRSTVHVVASHPLPFSPVLVNPRRLSVHFHFSLCVILSLLTALHAHEASFCPSVSCPLGSIPGLLNKIAHWLSSLLPAWLLLPVHPVSLARCPTTRVATATPLTAAGTTQAAAMSVAKASLPVQLPHRGA